MRNFSEKMNIRHFYKQNSTRNVRRRCLSSVLLSNWVFISEFLRWKLGADIQEMFILPFLWLFCYGRVVFFNYLCSLSALCFRAWMFLPSSRAFCLEKVFLWWRIHRNILSFMRNYEAHLSILLAFVFLVTWIYTDAKLSFLFHFS